MYDMQSGLLDSKVMAPKLTDAERELREKFVAEYLKDGDQYKATLRIGFLHSVASEYSLIFMNCPYVQRRITEAMTTPSFEQEERNRDSSLVKNSLRQVIMSGGYANKINASRALSDLHGLGESNNKKNGTGAVLGGVMVVPAIADIDAWEKEALASQNKLVQDTKHT